MTTSERNDADLRRQCCSRGDACVAPTGSGRWARHFGRREVAMPEQGDARRMSRLSFSEYCRDRRLLGLVREEPGA